jgi:predicted deacylase
MMRKACAAFFFGAAISAWGAARAEPVTIEGPHCEFETIAFDATFEGGRLAACRERRKGDYILAIRPEGAPINPSPWYAVDIQSSDKRKITVTLDYGDFRHRYSPDIKPDGGDWRSYEGKIHLKDDGALATFKLDLGEARKLRLAAQPLIVNEDTAAWMRDLAAAKSGPAFSVFGASAEGRPIHALETGAGKTDWLLVIGRQHPPETTGAIAMQAFVERIMVDDELALAFRSRIGVLAIPMLNPDGVAHGNWRNESSGKDMNRDWGPFEKPEPRLVRDEIEKRKAAGKRLVAGLDFHSTNRDVLYTQDDDDTEFGWFAGAWHEAINARLANESPAEAPIERDPGHNPGFPNYKTWINITYGVPGITVEFGDETDPERLRLIGHIAAEELMRLFAEDVR